MAKQVINLGTAPAGLDGDTVRGSFVKVNANFTELYDTKQPINSVLTSLSGLTGAADKLPYFTGAGALSLATLTTFGRSLTAAVDAGAVKTLLTLSNVNDTSDASKPVSTAQAAAIATKEPAITPDVVTKYFSGIKSWRDLATDVRAIALAGYISGANVALAASDSILTAFGKLQGQLAAKAPSSSPAFTGSASVELNFACSTQGGGLEVGRTDGVQGNGLIDFHCGATPIDYDARIIVTGGNGTNGQGDMFISAKSLSYSVAPTSGNHLVNKTYADTKLSLAGDTMTGLITNSNNGLLRGTHGGVTRGTLWADVNGFGILGSAGEWAARVPVGTSDWLVAGNVIAAGFTGNASSATTLTGLTATVAELNSVKGVTSAIQTQLAGKQASLGFTPIQQGGGVGQNTNKVYIGWSASGLLMQVDATDFANNWPISISKNAATATKLATPRTIMGVVFDGSANISQIDSGWLYPTLVNGFSVAGLTTDARIAYRKVGSTVYITGQVKNASATAQGTPIFTLPVGYRPSKLCIATAEIYADSLERKMGALMLGIDGTAVPGLQAGTANTNGMWYTHTSFEVA